MTHSVPSASHRDAARLAWHSPTLVTLTDALERVAGGVGSLNDGQIEDSTSGLPA